MTNYGTIVGHTLHGVELDQGGVVVNGASGAAASSAYIYGGNYGVRVDFTNIVNAPNLPGTVSNYGTIKSAGNGAGVELRSSGTLFNAYDAVISGYIGVQVLDTTGFTSTVTNAGTFQATGGSNLALMLSGTGDRLIIDPGAVFLGNVSGAGAALALAAGSGIGTLTSLGAQFAGFGTVSVDSGAQWLLNSGTVSPASFDLVNNGVVETSGGTLEINGNVSTAGGGTGTLQVDGGASDLRLDHAIDAGQTVEFTQSTGTPTIEQPGSFAATIAGFVQGDIILAVGATSGTFDNSTHQLTLLHQATPIGTLTFTGNYQPSGFSVAADGTVTYACFAAGTRIQTTRGAIDVAVLRAGDMIVTASGGARPAIWIGRRTVDCRRHPRPDSVWPVSIAANAFAPGVPARELRLSPDHAVFVDDVLIPIKYLINDTTIVQVKVDQVVYYHVELDRHDVLLAEQLPAESYLDVGGRSAFENAGVVIAQHADFSRRVWEADSVAPLVVTGPTLDAVVQLLGMRASQIARASARQIGH